MRRRDLLVPMLLLCACEGPAPGPDSGTGIGTPPLLASNPASLELDATCAGGTRRASLLLTNRASSTVDAMAGGSAGVEAYPSIFAVGGYAQRELVAVIQVPEASASTAKGQVRVEHRLLAAPEEKVRPLSIPWKVEIAADAPAATVLCGEPIDCSLVDFGTVFAGAVWQQPLEVVNDGCAPLRVERVILEGADLAIAGPALPATLAPGARWQATLLYEPGPAGARQGTFTVVTDDPAKGAQPIGWTAQVQR